MHPARLSGEEHTRTQTHTQNPNKGVSEGSDAVSTAVSLPGCIHRHLKPLSAARPDVYVVLPRRRCSRSRHVPGPRSSLVGAKRPARSAERDKNRSDHSGAAFRALNPTHNKTVTRAGTGLGQRGLTFGNGVVFLPPYSTRSASSPITSSRRPVGIPACTSTLAAVTGSCAKQQSHLIACGLLLPPLLLLLLPHTALTGASASQLLVLPLEGGVRAANSPGRPPPAVAAPAAAVAAARGCGRATA